MVGLLHIDHRRAGVEVAGYIVLVLALHKGVAVGVNGAFPADGAAVCLIAVEKDKAGLAGDRVADQRCFGVVNQLIGADIAVNIAGGLQTGALLDMQVHIGPQANGVAVKHIAALQHHPAAAVFGTVVNGVLNGKGVIGGAVAYGTVLENIVFLQLFCSL